MLQNQGPTGWQKDDMFKLPAHQVPSWRVGYAHQLGAANNILLTTWGGIGDQICAEPTLRFALEHFKDCDITLASHIPEVFGHLKFKDVFDLRKERPIADDYLIFQTNSEASQWNLTYQFMCHNVIQCVDFASLCALRCHLPTAAKEIKLTPPRPLDGRPIMQKFAYHHGPLVAVHAGRHWQSKTFPKWWWDRVIDSLIEHGLTPVLIGKDGTGDESGQGVVATKSEGCIDLRNQTTLLETIWLLQNVPVVICNDSSPLHIAVSGKAFIGFVASAKHQDFISHWRQGQWKWRMEHFNKGGMWDLMSFCPNAKDELVLDKVDEATLLSWLPVPEVFGPWAREKCHEYFRTV